jgi:hypothetical protein
MTLTNTTSMTRTGQTEHMEDDAITVAEVFGEVSEAAVTSEAVTVSREIKAVADIIYRHVKRSATFVTS